MIHLATGLAVGDGRVLLVASRYPNHADPLWNLPGGRQQSGELLEETVAREVFEETRLRVDIGELAYVSESYDGATHFLNATFRVALRTSSFDTRAPRAAQDDKDGADHVVAVEWVPIEELAQRIVVRVVREPLLAYIRGALSRRYAGFHDAGITIEWPADSR
jgi:ADP-ribose pyrophosphatase YjhB (NUDIX family)